MTKANDWVVTHPFDLTVELNGIKARLEALEQRIYSFTATREEREADQKAINLKGLMKNG